MLYIVMRWDGIGWDGTSHFTIKRCVLLKFQLSTKRLLFLNLVSFMTLIYEHTMIKHLNVTHLKHVITSAPKEKTKLKQVILSLYNVEGNNIKYQCEHIHSKCSKRILFSLAFSELVLYI